MYFLTSKSFFNSDLFEVCLFSPVNTLILERYTIRYNSHSYIDSVSSKVFILKERSSKGYTITYHFFHQFGVVYHLNFALNFPVTLRNNNLGYMIPFDSSYSIKCIARLALCSLTSFARAGSSFVLC